ncbi:alpha/beta fold hydrolase [Bergeriella denitrificans]|uniref:Acetoin dehydrogenase E2 subunit dihydrolipoyllysine-residue acetyltransferase n=1 Tax=Bergeriella denitrificans TaxID=494 RepID=A0A378UJY1_BERDE|nr:alpha/beta hydrolase [Bergeriella denitrificans]STZ76969.1 acetoin dehydrogenase E2 subunit dihydrolipoyllysine-residue acetyltransferase [Bergeriella denitrificans]
MKPKIYLLCGLLCDATVWQHQAAALAPYFDVETFSFRGFDDLTAMAEHVLAQDSVPFVLAGHSMGARAALEICRLAPQRVEKLILFDTGVHPLKKGETEKRADLVQAAKQYGMPHLIAHWLLPMLAGHHHRQPEIVEPLSEMVLRHTHDDFAKQIRALLNRPDAAAVLRAIRCPLLLGTGELDTWSPVEQHQEMQQIAPHAKLSVFPSAGHMAPFETPHVVNRTLLEWLLPQAVSISTLQTNA